MKQIPGQYAAAGEYAQADLPACTWSGAGERHCLAQRRPAERGVGAVFATRPVDDGSCGHSLTCAILDALSDQIAVLDEDGRIVAVNAAWRRRAIDEACGDEAGDAPSYLGDNYLDVCRRATGPGADGAAATLAGITAVLDGDLPRFSHEYPCHAPTRQRWFSMTVTPLAYGARGAVVAHTDITARRQSEAELRIAAIAFESPEGMMVTDADGLILQVNQAFCAITGYGRDEVIGRRPACSARAATTPPFTTPCGAPSTPPAAGRARSGTAARTAKSIPSASTSPPCATTTAASPITSPR